MNESGIYMLLHSVIIGILLYVTMKYVMSQKNEVALDRSILISSIILFYMILFGHNLPGKINKNIYNSSKHM
jgi:hypothetical protein